MTDLDDLLGDAPPRPKRGRPTKEESARKLEAQLRAARQAKTGVDADLPDAAEFRRPVTISWLTSTTRMDRRTIEERLKKCPVIEYTDRTAGRGAMLKEPLFDYMTAMSFLVEPTNFDLERYLLSLSSSTNAHKIPNNLHKGFWDAMNAKAKWLREAKETWHDADVLEYLGKAASMIRDQSLLWIENLPGRTNISNTDYHALRAEVVSLLKQLETQLVELPAKRKTSSVAAGVDTMTGGGSGDDEDLLS